MTSVISSPAANAAGSLPDLRLDPAPFFAAELPAEKGSITHWQRGLDPQRPWVIHIQDAHANASAQQSIRQILHWIDAKCREQGLSLSVAVEGASGKIHPEYFNLIPEYPRAGKAAVKKLAAQGELSGADLFAWDLYMDAKSHSAADKTRTRVFGAEKAKLYAGNLESFRKLLYQQDNVERLLVPIRTALERESSRVLSPDLRAFLKERRLRKAGDYGSGIETPQWETWLPYLAQAAKETLSIDLDNRFEQIRFPQMVRVLTLQKLDKNTSRGDAEKAENQKKALVSKLKKVALTAEARRQVEEFSQLEKNSNPRTAAEAAIELAEKYRIPLNDYPEFWKWAVRIILTAEITMDALASEMTRLEDAITNQLAVTPDAKKIVKTYAVLTLLEELLTLEMPRNHFDDLTNKSSLIGFLGEQNYLRASLSQKLTVYESLARDFYLGALKRDQALVHQTLRGQKPNSVAVLISGGFHTGGIETLLHSKDINFAVIRPVMKDTDHGEAYHRVLKESNADLCGYAGASAMNKQEAIILKAYLETALPVLGGDKDLSEKAVAEKTAAAMNAHPVLKNSLSFTVSRVNESARLIATPKNQKTAGVSGALIQAVAASDLMQTPQRFAASWRPVKSGENLQGLGSWTVGLRELGVKARSAVSGKRSEVRIHDDMLGSLVSIHLGRHVDLLKEPDVLQGPVLNIALETSLRGAIVQRNLVDLLRPAGVDIVGLDPNLPSNSERGYYRGDVRAIPFEDERFKTLVSFGLWDPRYLSMVLPEGENGIRAFYDQAVKEMDRVLQPEGLVFLSAYTVDENKYAQYLLKLFTDRDYSIEYQNGTSTYIFKKPGQNSAKSEIRAGAGIEALEVLKDSLNDAFKYGWAESFPNYRASISEIIRRMDPEQQALTPELFDFLQGWMGAGRQEISSAKFLELQPYLARINRAIAQMGLQSQFELAAIVSQKKRYEFLIAPQIPLMTPAEADQVLLKAVEIGQERLSWQEQHVTGDLSNLSVRFIREGVEFLKSRVAVLQAGQVPQTAAQWREWFNNGYATRFFYEALKRQKAETAITVNDERSLQGIRYGGFLTTGTFYPRHDGMSFPQLVESMLWLTGQELRNVDFIRLQGFNGDDFVARDKENRERLDLAKFNHLSFTKQQGIWVMFRSEARRMPQPGSLTLAVSSAKSEVRVDQNTLLFAAGVAVLAAGLFAANAVYKRRQKEQFIPNLRKIIQQGSSNLVGLLIAPDSENPGKFKYMRIVQQGSAVFFDAAGTDEMFRLHDQLGKNPLMSEQDLLPIVIDSRPDYANPFHSLDMAVALSLIPEAELDLDEFGAVSGFDPHKARYEDWRIVTRDAETDERLTAMLHDSIENVKREFGRSEVRLSGADFAALDKVATEKLSVAGVHNLSGVKDEADKMAQLAALNPTGILIRSNTKVNDAFLTQLKTAVEASGNIFKLEHVIRLGHGLDNVTFTPEKFPQVKVRGTKGSARSISALALRMTALAAARNLQQPSVVAQDQAPELSFLPLESFRKASAEKISKRPESDRALLQEKSDEMLVPVSGQALEAMRGRVVGVIGPGNIGEELIARYRELGLEVWVNSRTMENDTSARPNETHYRYADKDEIYQYADFVVVLTGLSPSTKGMIGAHAIDLMSKNPDLKAVINPDRGKIVDEAAMAKLLQRAQNKVLYLLDDVPDTEVLRSLALYTDHIGGTTAEAENSIRSIVERILRELIENADAETQNPDEELLKAAQREVQNYLRGLVTSGAIGEDAFTKDLASTMSNLKDWLGDPEIDVLSPLAKDSVREAIRSGRWADLIEAFRQQVSFGTAGIRGMSAYSQGELEQIAREGVGAKVLKGPNTINDVVLLKTTAGLIRYMQEQGEHKVVIGYDSRVAGSEFAELIAKSFAGASTAGHPFEIALFDEASPFPELSFAVTVQRADKGILISASHNPSNYNGFKITDRTGAQLTGSLRDAIVASIGKSSLSDIKLKNISDISPQEFTWMGGSVPLTDKDYQGHTALVDMHSLHVAQVKKFIEDPAMLQQNAANVSVGFAAFNGAGNKAVPRLLSELGFTNTKVVESLQKLNGLFPAFGWGEQPDPGDPIAADIAVRAFIDEHGQDAFDALDLLIGTDPDADRAGIIVKVPADQQARFGKYKLLSANDAWTLLLWYRFQREAELHGTNAANLAKQYITYSHVTTDALEAVGNHFGIASRGDMLNKQGQSAGGYLEGRRSWVGFSYIAAFANKMRAEGFTNVGGAEESNGFSILGGPVAPGEVLGAGGHVNDKDGTFAAVLLAEAAAYAKSKGTSLFELLDEIYGQIGYYATANKPLPRVGAFFGSSGKEKKIRLLRTAQEWLAAANDKTKQPFKIAGREVIGAVQWQSGRYDSQHYGGFPDEGVRFFFQDPALPSGADFTLSHNYLTIRPSGTSQTLRFYTQFYAPISSKQGIAEVKSGREKEALDVALLAQVELLEAAGYQEGDIDHAAVLKQMADAGIQRSEVRLTIREIRESLTLVDSGFGDKFYRGIIPGDRPALISMAADLFDLIAAAEPSALERAMQAITQYPEDWSASLHDGEEGANTNKRTVKIKLTQPLSYRTEQDIEELFNEIHVTGTLFTRQGLAEKRQHRQYSRGLSIQNDRLTERAAQIFGDAKGLDDLSFDKLGKPMARQGAYPLLGGHGAQSAHNKFLNSRYRLPREGYRGPLALGFGEFETLSYDNKKLGIYISLHRVDEFQRFGEYVNTLMEQALTESSQKIKFQLGELQRLAMSAMSGALVSGPNALSALAKGSDLRRALRDPREMIVGSLKEAMPVTELQRLFRSYGRSARQLIGDDLSQWQNMRIPYRYPHTGNMALDVKGPKIDGQYYSAVWYDLGGWKFGRDMTQRETFAYLYYVLDYFVQDMLRWQKQYNRHAELKAALSEVDAVTLFLQGFFYDSLTKPEFQRWKVTEVESHTNLTSAYYAGDFSDLPPVDQRVDKPFVALLREKMKMPPLTDSVFLEPLRDITFQQMPETLLVKTGQTAIGALSVQVRRQSGARFVGSGESNGFVWRLKKREFEKAGAALWMQIHSKGEKPVLLADVRINTDQQGFITEVMPLLRFDYDQKDLYEVIFNTLRDPALRSRIPAQQEVRILLSDRSLAERLSEALKPYVHLLDLSDYEKSRLRHIETIQGEMKTIESMLASLKRKRGPTEQRGTLSSPAATSNLTNASIMAALGQMNPNNPAGTNLLAAIPPEKLAEMLRTIESADGGEVETMLEASGAAEIYDLENGHGASTQFTVLKFLAELWRRLQERHSIVLPNLEQTEIASILSSLGAERLELINERVFDTGQHIFYTQARFRNGESPLGILTEKRIAELIDQSSMIRSSGPDRRRFNKTQSVILRAIAALQQTGAAISADDLLGVFSQNGFSFKRDQMVRLEKLIHAARNTSARSEVRSTLPAQTAQIRVSQAQVNVLVGDLVGNYQRILAEIQKAKTAGADMIVFPELALTGYPAEDLLLKKHFIRQNQELIQMLAKQVHGITVVVGFVDSDEKPHYYDPGRKGNLYNAAAVISDGKVQGVYHKHDLPNYSVFDDKRHFSPGTQNPIFKIKGIPFAVNICEDIWINGGVFLEQAKRGAKFLINPSASPYRMGVGAVREDLLRQRVQETGIPIIYTNVVGGQDEVVYDGGSFIMGKDGAVLARARSFKDTVAVTDLTVDVPAEDAPAIKDIIDVGSGAADSENRPVLATREIANEDEIAVIYEGLVLATRDYIKKNGFKKAIFGNSGGIDSAVVGAIAKAALGSENVEGVSMPTRYNSKATKDDARRLANNLKINFRELPIIAIFEVFLAVASGFGFGILGWAAYKLTERLASWFPGAEFAKNFKKLLTEVPAQNVQARIRGMLLMFYSNSRPATILLSTGNKSENAMGYATLYGDMAGGFAPIKDVPKGMVFKLARYINQIEGREVIPVSIIDRPPSAELAPGQKDTDSLPPYETVLDPIIEDYLTDNLSIDEIVSKHIGETGFSEEVVRRVVRTIDRNEYKRRQGPPGPKITRRALNRDRRMPISNGYHEENVDDFLVEARRPKKIGIMGVTGNPVQLGHVISAESVRKELGLDEVLLIPSNETPDREDTHLLVSNTDRLAMAELAVAGKEGVRVSDVEIARGGKSYTIDTIEQLTDLYPAQSEFYLIVGRNRVNTLPNWKRADELLGRVKVVVANRPGFEGELLPEFVRHVVQLPIDRDISSSQVRDRLSRGESIHDLVAPAVENYIYEHGLYGAKRSEVRASEPAIREKIAKMNLDRPKGYPERRLDSPPTYTSPNVIKNARSAKNPQGWAYPNLDDPKMPKAERKRLIAELRADVLRFAPNTRFDETTGLPVNVNETGLNGRGRLGRYGPNPAEDPVVLRYNKAGELELLAIERRDGGGMALPGGMIERGQENQAGVTATRELKEETSAEIDMTKGVVVFEGPVDEWRNTNQAWMVTRGVAVLLSYEESKQLKVKARSDAKKKSARFVPVTEELLAKMYANHATIVRAALDKINNGQLLTAQQKVIKKYDRVSLTLPDLEDAYQAFREGKYKVPENFDLVAPEAPHGGQYLVAAGLEEALADVRARRFTKGHIEALRKLERFSEEFLKYLQNFIFEGDIDAVKEGTVLQPGLPLMRIKATPVEMHLMKSLIQNRIGFSTNIATKTARIAQAANGDFVSAEALESLRKSGLSREQIKRIRALIDFGQRRAQGKAATVASRAAVIGGAMATSNVKAAKQHYLEPSGTMAHLFITSFPPEQELEAFRLYAKTFPKNTVLLIDTYNTIEGAKNAIIVAKEMAERGEKLLGVRLDSGDLVALSKEVRRMFDEAGLHDVKIVASDDLDEFKITELLEKGAQIDFFGVGTNLITGGKQAHLNLKWEKSDGSRLWRAQQRGQFSHYIKTPAKRTAIAAYSEEMDEILVPFWRAGQRVSGHEKPWKAHERAVREIAKLKPEHKMLKSAELLPVQTQDNALSINPETDAVLVIDAQKAFMKRGGLTVAGGDDIMPSVRNIMNLFSKDKRYASIDRHPRGSISWASSFVGFPPFTYLTYDMVKDWKEGDHHLAEHALFTLDELKAELQKIGGQMLWPDHAAEGTDESQLHESLRDREFAHVEIKGMDPKVDSYSAFFDNAGNPTQLAGILKAAGIKRLFIVGLALDYCVGFSAEGAIKNGFDVVVLPEATRSVNFPEGSEEKMFSSFQEKGIIRADVKDFLAANRLEGVRPARQIEPVAHPIAPREDDNVGLEEDAYHLTMGAAVVGAEIADKPVTFDYFFRTAPYGEDKIIVSGLQFMLEEISKFRFTEEDIDYLRTKTKFGFSEAYLQKLRDFKFNGTIEGLPEGSVAYGREPILRVRGTFLESLIVETFILKTFNFNSLIATYANKIRREKGDTKRLILDALAGAQGISYEQAEYSAFIGGINATTDLDAHLNYGIPLADKKDEGEKLGADFITGGPKASLGGVYKLAVFDGEDRMKLSENPIKSSLPGNKEVIEIRSPDGQVKQRLIALEGERPARDKGDKIHRLFVPLVSNGEVVYRVPDIWEVQDHRENDVLRTAAIHETAISPRLQKAQAKAQKRVAHRAMARSEVRLVESELSDDEVTVLKGAADNALQAALDILVKYDPKNVPRERKPDASWVTEADQAIQQAVIASIQRAFPDHYVLGEETLDTPVSIHNEANKNSDYVWILDPIDGTRVFLEGSDDFAVSLALYYKGRPVLARTYSPYLQGTLGLNQTDETKPAAVSNFKAAAFSRFNGIVAGVTERPAAWREKMSELLREQGVRPQFSLRVGSTVARSLKVIQDDEQFYADLRQNPPHLWDVAAVAYLLEKSGALALVWDEASSQALPLLEAIHRDLTSGKDPRKFSYPMIAVTKNVWEQYQAALRASKRPVAAAAKQAIQKISYEGEPTLPHGWSALSNRQPDRQKPYAAVFDLHGVLLEPTWKRQFAYAYQRLMGGDIDAAMSWVETHAAEDLKQKLITLSGKSDTEIKDLLARLVDEIPEVRYPPVIPGALELVNRLQAAGVPVIVMSGSNRRIIIDQLRQRGFVIPDEHILGRDDMALSAENRQYVRGTREEAIESLSLQFPGHQILHFTDGKIGIDTVRGLKGINFGMLHGTGEAERSANRNILSGVDILAENGLFNAEQVFNYLRVDSVVQGYDWNYSLAESTAAEIANVLPAARPSSIGLHIEISEDLRNLAYLHARADSAIFLPDGRRAPYPADELEIASFPSGHLVSPIKWMEERLTFSQIEAISRLWALGQRYTTYDGITVSWDQSVDRDVWTTNIDTVYIHRMLQSSGILKTGSVNRAVEIGTGGGHLATLLAARLPELRELSVTDISLYALRAAKRNVLPFLGSQTRLRTFWGKGLGSVGKDIDLLVVNPPYIPTSPFDTRTHQDPYRGTGLIREVVLEGGKHLNPDNPNASIFIGISSLAQRDFDRYVREAGDSITLQLVGTPIEVPLKIRTISKEWIDWLVSEGLLKKKMNVARGEEEYWHTLQVYRLQAAKRSEVRVEAQPVTGLIFGKFAPFHRGHELMIRQALEQVDKLIVLVYDHPELMNIRADEMAQMIRKIIHDDRLTVIPVYDAPPSGDTPAVNEAHLEFMRTQIPPGVKINKVFNNEWYGARMAEGLGAQLIQTDPKRVQIPVSATQIRANPKGSLALTLLDGEVYRRINLPGTRLWESPVPSILYREALDPSFVDRPMEAPEKKRIRRGIVDKNPGYADQNKLLHMMPWQPEEFRNAHSPSFVGTLPADAAKLFSAPRGLRILDLAIRMPGKGWAIPKVLAPYQEAIRMAVEHERAINPRFDEEYYVYVTIDQKVVQPGKTQRRAGAHGDAFVTRETNDLTQGVITDNTYIMSDRAEIGTYLYPGPFPLDGIDLNNDAAVLRRFDELAAQQTPEQMKPYEMIRMTPYDIHAVATNKTDHPIERTFIKIQFSRDKLNMAGNMINRVEDVNGRPVFDYSDWTWVPRDPKKRNNRNSIVGWNRTDGDQFKEIDLSAIDFSKDTISADWAEPDIFWAKKNQRVHIQAAVEGEALETRVNGDVVSFNIAQKGDWKIRTSQGDEYFLSEEKLKKRYWVETPAEGFVYPRAEPVRMVKVKTPIRFRAPWGAWQYLSPGSVIAYLGPNDVYGIHRDNFNSAYRKTDAAGNLLDEQLLPINFSATDEDRAVLKNQMIQGNPDQPSERLFNVEKWDIREWDKPHLPVIVGTLSSKEPFKFNGMSAVRYLDLLVYAPGQGWAIPKELEPFQEAIRLAVNAEQLVNPKWADRFVHLTVDQKWVNSNQHGRRAGLHGDGGLFDFEDKQLDVVAANRDFILMQQGRRIDHAYLFYDGLPTAFYPGPFSLRTSAAADFESVAARETPVTYPAHTLLRLNAYDIHTSTLNASPDKVQRTFLKIQFTERLLQRRDDKQSRNEFLDDGFARQVSQSRSEVRAPFVVPIGGEGYPYDDKLKIRVTSVRDREAHLIFEYRGAEAARDEDRFHGKETGDVLKDQLNRSFKIVTMNDSGAKKSVTLELIPAAMEPSKAEQSAAVLKTYLQEPGNQQRLWGLTKLFLDSTEFRENLGAHLEGLERRDASVQGLFAMEKSVLESESLMQAIAKLKNYLAIALLLKDYFHEPVSTVANTKLEKIKTYFPEEGLKEAARTFATGMQTQQEAVFQLFVNKDHPADYYKFGGGRTRLNLLVQALGRSEVRIAKDAGFQLETTNSTTGDYMDRLRAQAVGADDEPLFSTHQRTVARRASGVYAAPAAIAADQGLTWEQAALAVFRVIAEEEGLVIDKDQVLPVLKAAREALGEFAALLNAGGESFQLADVLSAEQLNQEDLVYALAVHVLARPGDRLRLYVTGTGSDQSVKRTEQQLAEVLKKVGAPEGYGVSRITFIDASDWDDAKLQRVVRRDLGSRQSGLRGALLSARLEVLSSVMGSGIYGLQRQTKNANTARLITPVMLADSLDEHTVHQIEAWLTSKGMAQRLAARFTAMIAAVRMLAQAA